ncbi:PREDICTED: uncharacterized protein LOC106150326 [Chinchilla lanigera]|uniref:uncharacterized protein LOC106150326 n=1 Tax=Chinchilla lanigera TaxID=34839 RepID=UPI0006981FF9|nr:PREDICTED: uncharacterized protein LOC106150326 [Chinchilla lanigera]
MAFQVEDRRFDFSYLVQRAPPSVCVSRRHLAFYTPFQLPELLPGVLGRVHLDSSAAGGLVVEKAPILRARGKEKEERGKPKPNRSKTEDKGTKRTALQEMSLQMQSWQAALSSQQLHARQCPDIGIHLKKLDEGFCKYNHIKDIEMIEFSASSGWARCKYAVLASGRPAGLCFLSGKSVVTRGRLSIPSPPQTPRGTCHCVPC